MDNLEGSSRRKEIDKEISSYISFVRKKQKKGFSGVMGFFRGKAKNQNVDLHPEVKTYGGEPPKKSKEEEIREEEEIERDFEEGATKKTFWEKLKAIIVFEKEPDQCLADVEEPENEPEKVEYKKEEAPESEIEEEYAEETKKKGLIESLIEKIFVKTREEEEIEEIADEIAEDEQDIKAIAEMATKVMKMLPPEQMKELKYSEDFTKFKEILKKRGIIK